jgi:hypothetical protein
MHKKGEDKMAVTVRELLRLIPNNLLQQIGEDVGVDKVNQELTGERIFKVLLFSLAETTRISLRTIEKIYSSVIFQEFCRTKKGISTRHSSLADRLSKIKVCYFSSIFNHLVNMYHNEIASEKLAARIYRFDSTIVGLSAKLFYCGLPCGATQQKYLKVVIGLKSIPSSVYFCTDKSEASDDIAIKRAISEATINSNDFVVFDRGIQSAKTYTSLDEQKIIFVTRIKNSRKYKIIENYKTIDDSILSDQAIVLWNSKRERYFKTNFRLITKKSTEKDIFILTNNFDLTAIEIAEIYKRRWDIEVFFKFIKQELNFKHFLSRSLNGIMVYLYMILIFSILLLIYKIGNSLKGFKFVKWDFFHELEAEIIGDIIIICGGDPNVFFKKHGFACV